MNIWSDIMILLLPVMIALSCWLLRLLEQRLPEKQRAALDHFVNIAVKNVEQELDTVPSSQKKDAAIKIVESFFRFFKLPLPDEEIIKAATEAAVFELNQMKPSAQVRVNTGPIKTVLPPDSGGQLA